MTANVTGLAGTRSLADRGDDLYETPPQATRALLIAESLPRKIWEPACGRGAIADVLKATGHSVYATDLVDYGYDSAGSRRDFLFEREVPAGIQAIVTNPPYKLANEFVEHALKLCPRVYMFMRFLFLEGVGRSAILEDAGLRTVYLFRNRVPMMHRHGWNGKTIKVSAIAFAWFCWHRHYRGPTELHRISWER